MSRDYTNKERFVYIYLGTLIEQAKTCKKETRICPGDSGDAKCVFCNLCVLSPDEVMTIIQDARGVTS